MMIHNKLKKMEYTILFLFCLIGVMLSCSIYILAEEHLREIKILLEWVPNTNHTGVYVALEKGFYREEGLGVSVIQPEEGGAAPFIAAGQGEFGFSSQEQVTFARASDEPLPVVAVAAILQHNTSGFASPVAKEIKRPRNFEGKQYGGWGSPIEEATIKALMDYDGADFAKTEIVTIGAIDFFAAVQQYVDYTWIYYGWDGVASEVANFPINFVFLQDYAPELDYYTPIIIVSEELKTEEPELIKKFLKATEKGYQFSMSHPESAVEILLRHAPEIDPEIALASQRYLAEEYQSDAPYWGVMETKRWTNYADWLYEKGLIDNKLDAEAAFDNSFLPGKGN